jgi:hypothetical protein
MRIDWGQLMACVLNCEDGRDIRVAQWRACCEVLATLEAYRPVEFDAFPSLLLAPDGSMLAPADVADRVKDPRTEAATPLGVLFGWWRAHVTDVEARNAGRLQTLAQTLQTLADLHDKAIDQTPVHERIAELGQFIEDTWRTAVPLSGDIRGWAVRITRRYDLLPRAWREI